jgi:hypothetical protein
MLIFRHGPIIKAKCKGNLTFRCQRKSTCGVHRRMQGASGLTEEGSVRRYRTVGIRGWGQLLENF